MKMQHCFPSRRGLVAAAITLAAGLAPGLAHADKFTAERAKRAMALAQAEAAADAATQERFQMAPGAAAAAAQRQQIQPIGSQTTTAKKSPSTPAPSQPRFPKPTKTALIVILENGGVVGSAENLAPSLREKLNLGFTTAECSKFDLEMRSPADLPGLVAELARKGGDLAQCVDPRNWRLRSYTLRDWIDEMSDPVLENTIKGAAALNNARRRYDLVEVFEDKRAHPDTVMARMKALAPTHQMDLHILTHGTTNQFVGGGNVRFKESNFFGPLAEGERALDYRLFIRSVYQMNCFSGSLVEEWAGLGAETINMVAADKLNSMGWQYLHFMGKWLNENKTFEQATREAYNEAKLYTAPIYTVIGEGARIADSELRTVGNDSLRVSSR